MQSLTESTTEAPPAVKEPLRRRFLPRTVLGISALVLFTSLGAAFSGTVLYAYYQYRLDQNQKAVNRLTSGAEGQFKAAEQAIAAQKEAAKKEIADQLSALKQLTASGDTLGKLIAKVGPSVWFVHTQDEAGSASVGSAFVVASDAKQSLLVTSLSVVRASTQAPGPALAVRKGDQDLPAKLWTWQEDRDLALLVVDRPNLPKLSWATGKSAVSLGERVFAVSGLGSAGASIVQGSVADVFADGIQHSAPLGSQFRGGPLVNSEGAVIAVASWNYAPLGFSPGGGVTFGIPIQKACDRILRCPGGTVGGAGAGGG